MRWISGDMAFQEGTESARIQRLMATRSIGGLAKKSVWPEQSEEETV
jgi:hypothetical protein